MKRILLLFILVLSVCLVTGGAYAQPNYGFNFPVAPASLAGDKSVAKNGEYYVDNLKNGWLVRFSDDPTKDGYKKRHTAVDWNRKGRQDFGDPIYSIGNGSVVWVRDKIGDDSRYKWGKVAIIRYPSPLGTPVDMLIAHMDKMYMYVGMPVSKCQVLGTIGDGNGFYGGPDFPDSSPHLHLEFRVTPDIPCTGSMDCVPGNPWMDPNDPANTKFRNYMDPLWLLSTYANPDPECASVSVLVGTGAVKIRGNASTTMESIGSAPEGSIYPYYDTMQGDGAICDCWHRIDPLGHVNTTARINSAYICGGWHGESWTSKSCSTTKPTQVDTIFDPKKLGDVVLASGKIEIVPLDVGGNPEGGDYPVPPPPSKPPSPPPYIPPGASLTATTADSPMQMETLVQGGVQGTASHTANVWLEYGTSTASAVETAHRTVNAGSFSETFDLPVSAGCGATITYRGVAELANTTIITYGNWKNTSTLPCPIAPSTTPFPLTITPTCPEGTFINERISWEDQKAAQYTLYVDGIAGGTNVSPLAREIYKVPVGTTHTFQVKAYFSNGTSLLSKSMTYTLEANPCTGPVFPAMEIPTYDPTADTFIADVLDPVTIQKLGGSATTLAPNVKLHLYTASYGDTGSVETKIFPFNPLLPLVMERQVIVSNLDKSPCFLGTNTGQSFGIVHLVKAAGTYCGGGRDPSATFHAGDVNSLACGADLHARIPIGSPFRELFLFEPQTGKAHLFINGKISATANLPPIAPHATEIALYCNSERYEGGEITSDYWHLWQEGGGAQKNEALTASTPPPKEEPLLQQLALDATTSASNTTAGNALSFPHTSNGTNRLLAVTVSTAADVEAVRSITYDNLPLAKAVGVDQMGRLSQIWYLAGQPTGAHTVAISTVGSGRIVATALSLTGAAQSNVLGATATATGFDTTPTAGLPTKHPGSILIDSVVLNFESPAPTAGGEQTMRGNLKGYSGIQHATSTEMAREAGAHTMSWMSSGMWGTATAEFRAASVE